MLAAFHATGIHPFNPAVVTADKLAPSKATSILSSYPVALPAVVERVAASFDGWAPTSFDLDPEHDISSSPMAVPSSPASARRRSRNPDDDLQTPTKRRRLIASAIAASPLSRWLLSHSPITANHRLLTPVLNRAAPFQQETHAESLISPSKMSRAELERLVRSQKTDLARAESRMVEQEQHLNAAHATSFIQHRQQILFGDGKARLLTEDGIIEA
ncbi:hypothetical protein C8F01DRAFT_1185319, partial [Mycena amicta]